MRTGTGRASTPARATGAGAGGNPAIPAGPAAIGQGAAGQAGPPPLYGDLGTLHVPITTSNPKAQAFFDQGMRLTFALNHA